MVGGLLNIISKKETDIILIGNPNKSFFKKGFTAHSMFGKQKFRIDFEGSTRLNYNSSTIYNFKIPRYGDLLQEMFFSFTLPNIWSPLISFGGTTALFCSACRTNISTSIPNYNNLSVANGDPWKVFVNDASYGTCSLCDCSCSTQYTFWNATEYNQTSQEDSIISNSTPTTGGMKWINQVYPLEFKWIENIGVQAIKNIRIYSNNSVIQEFTGQYLLNMVYRDFSENQKKKFDRMIGNVPELNDPKNYANRNGNYPNTSYFGNMSDRMAYGLEPSIRSRQLYIPINIWSTLNNKTPLPLISMQASELRIEIEMRPVNEWWIIKNVVNKMTLKASNNMLKYNSTGVDTIVNNPSCPNISGGNFDIGPGEENMNFVEIPNKITAFNQVIPNPVHTELPSDLYVPLDAEDTGLAIIDINKNDLNYSWYKDTQIEFPEATISKELQIATVIPLTYTAPNVEYDIYNLRFFLKEPPPKMIIDQIEDYSGSLIKEVGALPYPMTENKIVNRYYSDVPEPWFADIHIIGNYVFLGNNERNEFATNTQSYLIREVHEQTITDLLGGDNYTTIETRGLVSSWMWYFQRSDVKYRNQWSNYTNKNYLKDDELVSSVLGLTSSQAIPKIYGEIEIPNSNKLTDIVWQTEYSVKNSKDILINWGIDFDSAVREEVLESPIVAWVDRYSRSQGKGIDGVYYYNFCLNTDPFNYQPSGAVNLSKFNKINWKYKLTESQIKINLEPNNKPPWNIFSEIEDPFLEGSDIGPYLSNNISITKTCLPGTKVETSINYDIKEKYIWYYNLHVMEERYNILKVENGIAGLVFDRTI